MTEVQKIEEMIKKLAELGYNVTSSNPLLEEEEAPITSHNKILISNEDYHASEAVGSTLLKDIAAKSVLHAVKKEVKETTALKVGSAFHALVLEPETFDENFCVAPVIDRRTKAGKAEYAEFQAQNVDKTALSQVEFDQITAMSNAIKGHETAASILRGGESEYSYFAKDCETGLELKCRPDYVNKGALIDLKTTDDASPEGFLRSIQKFGYHIQAAYYLDVYNQANGTNLNEFIFICVEKSEPNAVAIYQLDEISIEAGRKIYKNALKKYADFKNNKDAKAEDFGYSKNIVELQLPIWALEKAESL